jgi:pentatricopeptide repeat protein
MEESDDDLFLEEVDDDDDYIMEFTPAEAEAKRQAWMQRLRHLARSSNRDDTAVTKAQAIFDEMFETYIEQEDSIFFPDVQVYNLLLETHAYSKAEDGAEQAETILQKMETAGSDNPYVVKPNEESYLNVMDAWALRKRPDKVREMIQQLQENENDDEDLQPTINAYNKLIKAHGIAGDIEEAEELFRSLLDEEDDELPPADHKTWVQMMKAYLNQGFASHVEDLFQEMSESDENFEPQTAAYNVLIRAIGESHPKNSEALLYDMMERFRKGEQNVKPNADTFRNVLLAYNSDPKKQYASTLVAKLDQLLQIQDSFLTLHGDDGDEPWKPDERLYNTVIGIIARSKDNQKATRIKRMIDRFEKASDPSLEALSRFNASLLKACAFTDGTAEEKLAAFQIALGVLGELRKGSNGMELDVSTAGMFLKACRNLMPEGSKRDEVVQSVFDDCCSRGIVGDFVVNELEMLLSGSMQLELLGGFIEDGVRIKKEWRRNVHSRSSG